MTTAAESVRLIFHWTARQDRRRRLALWFLLVLILNAAGLVVFRMHIPPASPRELSDATLFLPAPDSDLAKELRAYLAAADPALFAADRSSRKLLEPSLPAYVPSFDQAAFKPLALPAQEGRLLSSLAGEQGAVPVNDPQDALQSAPVASSQKRKTFVRLDGEIKGRTWQNPPNLDEIAPPQSTLLPTVFIVGVTPGGRLRHVVLRRGSGNVGADNAALKALLQAEMHPVSEASAPAWGILTIHWVSSPSSEATP